MKFLRPFQRTPQPKPAAYSLVDIGRDTVKAVVVLIIPGTPVPQVIGWGLANTGHHDVSGGRIAANAVTTSVNAALTQAEDSTVQVIGQKVVPDEVVFALAGRATVGKLFAVRQARHRPADPISLKEMRSLRSRTERLVRQGLAALPVEGGHWQALAVADAGIRLDDHLVLEGLGLTGQEISFALFGVAGQAATLRALELLAERLDLNIANVVASTQALATITPHAEAIILDTGFSGTDICLIVDNALVATAWVPFGGGFFTQALAQASGLNLAEAEQLKRDFTAGRLAQDEADMVDAFLDGPRCRWYNAVMDALLELSRQPGFNDPGSPGAALAENLARPLPRRLYMTGGGSLLPGLEGLLRSNVAPFSSAPEITRLGSRPIPALKDLTDKLDYDLFALALSLTAGLPD